MVTNDEKVYVLEGMKMSLLYEQLKNIYNVDDDILLKLREAISACEEHFKNIQHSVELNQLKVLRAFQINNVSDYHLNGSTGYGYGDSGRDTLEEVYASTFGGEKALVRAQIVSGTHAIAVGLLGNLDHGDEMICVTGTPYDTLLKVIGMHNEYGSLKYNGVIYKELPLTREQKIDIAGLKQLISPRTKLVYFQRSKGYQWRPSIMISELKEAIQYVKQQYPHIICMVDNCYGEFVETQTPCEIGADLTAGSLIKNPGGGLALSGGYLVGRVDLIERAAVRLSSPGIGLDVGASFNFNRSAYQGLFMSPLVVGEALKGAVLAAKFFQLLGYPVLPQYNEKRTDIIQAVQVGSREKMVAFCHGIQKACPLDSVFLPEPALLPGYDNEVIMAGGTFIQGSSIELSADGPIRPPFNIYLQGGLSFSHIKIGLALAAAEIKKLER